MAAGAAAGGQAAGALSSVAGPEMSAGGMFGGRIGDAMGDLGESGSLWDQIVTMVTGALDSGLVPGSKAGVEIGSAHLDR